MACGLTLTLTRMGLNVKVISQMSRSNIKVVCFLALYLERGSEVKFTQVKVKVTLGSRTSQSRPQSILPISTRGGFPFDAQPFSFFVILAKYNKYLFW